MRTILKKSLIICMLTLPNLAFAAEQPAGVPPKTALPKIISAPTEALLKSAETPHATRIGYVDISRIATESERGKTLRIVLISKKDKLQAKIEEKKKALDKLKTSIEAKIAKMTPKQREVKSKEFQKKLEDLQKLAQASEEEFLALQEKETKALYEAIELAAVAHGKANGFAAVVIKKELLYLGNTVDAQDVTDALIKALDQAGEKK